jgi:hypothetical protein
MSGYKPGDITAKNIKKLIEKRTETYDPYEYEQINKKIDTLRKYQNDTIETDNKYKYLKKGSSNPTFSPPPRRQDSSR